MASSSTSSSKHVSAAERRQGHVSAAERRQGQDSPAERALTPIPRSFFGRDTLTVAQDLLGKILAFRPTPRDPWVLGRIVETEAYHGDDPASHCSRGRTDRCAIMFEEPGHAYVYFIYGMYEMLNFVTERKGYPGAVLIRALEPVEGAELMRRRRIAGNRAKGAKALPESQLANGPGRLCRALGIRLSHNGEALDGPLFRIYDDGVRYRPNGLRASPRVGIARARERLWRYFVADSPCVSKVPQNSEAVALTPLEEGAR